MSADISQLSGAGQEIEEIPVRISYEIIRLFSEGLYQSPHKAIEELVSNGYDAEASRVHVLLPEQPENETDSIKPLWVIDDGNGMNEDGFRQLWRIADTNKGGPLPPSGRAPIGQFGIGKLAAYVLAWKLTHISRVADKLLLTAMDFRQVTGRQRESINPIQVSLREVDEATAKLHLSEIEHRDPAAWKFMFGDQGRNRTWTAAGMSDFRDLYNKLSTGTLKWVLSTGLPLHTNFKIWLNGQRIVSSKENIPEIESIPIDEDLPGIGNVKGTACIHEKQLTTGKSEQIGRSHGFFIRVRERVINLEDELFGIQQPNHAAWSRFALEINADGLREHLLSSREGVRDSEEIRSFRKYLLDVFNRCRTAYEKRNKKENEQLDIIALLSENPSTHVTEPLIRSVRNTVEADSESFYIGIPHDVEEEHRSQWLTTYEEQVSKKPFDETKFVHYGPNAPALRYDPTTRSLVVNADHPFVDKLTDGDKHRNPAKLFASSEVLLEGQLQDQGIDRAAIANFLRDRDRVLRLMAGDAPPTAVEVLRRLDAASESHAALERAVGAVFQVLGFEYERKGGNTSGPDGVLYARLGRHKGTLADYKLIYDAKQTNHPSVSADKIDLASLEEFRKKEYADFGFFIATAYAAESDQEGVLNRRIDSEKSRCLTLLKIEHLRRLVQLHYQHGVTLTELRTLFENAHIVPEVNDWIDSLESKLEQGRVPLSDLLHGLEREKNDPKATPSIIAVRAKHLELRDFEPERLIARLRAVENIIGSRWIEVEEDSGNVFMHQTADQNPDRIQSQHRYVDRYDERSIFGAERMNLSPIHPFPARMAPELARRSLGAIPKDGRVLDPMCGSGTVARASVEAGFQCIGIDIDPLAVLMSRAWVTRLEPDELHTAAHELVETARSLSEDIVERTTDPETGRFISYWFAPRQESQLARLATVLRQQRGPMKDALAVALSRIIVSKEMMASLARDTSHSRPHRVADSNDFDVYTGFLRSARYLAARLKPGLIKGQAEIRLGDARTLEGIDDESVDLALTSPPYLNAIDYLRGHRLALVWLGYEMKPLREIRSVSVGAENMMLEKEASADVLPFVLEKEGSVIGHRHLGWIRRYAYDMEIVLLQIRRVVKRTGQLVMVLGNSFIRGAEVDNAKLVEALAKKTAFQLESRHVREIPARRRYLPPPGDGQNALDVRMRTETVLTFSVA